MVNKMCRQCKLVSLVSLHLEHHAGVEIMHALFVTNYKEYWNLMLKWLSGHRLQTSF